MFAITSRYYGMATSTLEMPDHRKIVYLRRHFVPSADRFQLLVEHTVSQGERLDNIAAQYMDDPEQFWRIADANNAQQPDDLTTPVGRRLRITLPEGIPGTPNA